MKRDQRTTRSRGDLALFAAISIAGLLAIAVGGELLFEHSLREPLGQ